MSVWVNADQPWVWVTTVWRSLADVRRRCTCVRRAGGAFGEKVHHAGRGPRQDPRNDLVVRLGLLPPLDLCHLGREHHRGRHHQPGQGQGEYARPAGSTDCPGHRQRA